MQTVHEVLTAVEEVDIENALPTADHHPHDDGDGEPATESRNEADRPPSPSGSLGSLGAAATGAVASTSPTALARRLVSYHSAMTDPLRPVLWEVEPLIARGNRVVLYGEFGAMKSWLLLGLATYWSAGEKWLGEFPVPEARRVLYIDEEMGERTLRRRIRRLAVGAGLETRDLPLQFLSHAGIRFAPSSAARLLNDLAGASFDPDVIVFETLRRGLVGSENEAKDVSEFWRNVEPIVRAGKTLVVSHHMRKPNRQGGNDARDRASGSTDILAGADTAIALERPIPDVVTVECVKSRDAEERRPFAVYFEAEDPDGPVRLAFGGAWNPRTRGLKQDEAVAVIEEYLAGCPDQTASTATILTYAKSQGVAKSTAEHALKPSGRLRSLGRGSWQLESTRRAA